MSLTKTTSAEDRRDHQLPAGEHPAGPVRRLLPHLPFLVLLVAGTVLRGMAWRAYRPALLYPDSYDYLTDAAELSLNPIRPSGYSGFIWPLLEVGDLATISLAQHVLGLALGAAIYLLLLRLRVWPWLAALAAAPVLLDAMQLVIEQYVMADVLFQALLLGACMLLLWRRRPGPWLVAAAGLALGGAAVVRGAGTLLLIPAAVTVVVVTLPHRRRAAGLVALLAVGFALPVGTYMLAFRYGHGELALTSYTQRFLYSRLAPIADCRGLELPAYERVLCPTAPPGERLSTNQFMWDLERSPQYDVTPPPGMDVEEVLGDWNQRIIRHQPVDYAEVVTVDFLRSFQPTRDTEPGDVPLYPWLFHPEAPDNGVPDEAALYRSFAGYGPVVDRSLATALVSYQEVVYTPGPLLAACIVVALLAVLGVGRARRSGLRVPAWTLGAVCLVPLGTAALASTFSWRYQLPQLVLLAPAGAIGVAALMGRRAPEATPAEQTGDRDDLVDSARPTSDQS